VKAALSAAGVNIAFKIAFLYFTTLSQVGLALATSIGTWINFGLITWFGLRAGFLSFDAAFKRAVGKLIAAGLLLIIALWVAQWPVLAITAGLPHIHNVVALIVLALIGALVYGAAIVSLLGKRWLISFSASPRMATPRASAPPEPE
jgi:putative peptidoglycan lipid II flippase